MQDATLWNSCCTEFDEKSIDIDFVRCISTMVNSQHSLGEPAPTTAEVDRCVARLKKILEKGDIFPNMDKPQVVVVKEFVEQSEQATALVREQSKKVVRRKASPAPALQATLGQIELPETQTSPRKTIHRCRSSSTLWPKLLPRS